jgi:DNA-binding MarR family transcriptional regulator
MASPTKPRQTAAGALLHVLMLVMRTVAADMRRSANSIAPPQMGLLMKIGDGPTTMSSLARSHAVSLPTISKSVDILVDRGWVARWVDRDDRRQTMVRLTAKGRRVLAGIMSRTEKQVAARLAPLQPHERAQLVSVMNVLARVLTTPGTEGCAP